MRKSDSALLLFNEFMPSELDSDDTGAMGADVAGGGGSPRSNHNSARAHHRKGGVGGGVGKRGHGSCTRVCWLSELDVRWNGVDGGGGEVGGCEDPPVS